MLGDSISYIRFITTYHLKFGNIILTKSEFLWRKCYARRPAVFQQLAFN